jgi:outer membrane protein assembly factor BamB
MAAYSSRFAVRVLVGVFPVAAFCACASVLGDFNVGSGPSDGGGQDVVSDTPLGSDSHVDRYVADGPDGGGGGGDADAGPVNDPICGDMGGLQASAPWPMVGRCATHVGQSNLKGAGTSTLKWHTSIASAPSGAAIAADGTIYYCDTITPSASLNARSGSNGQFRWQYGGVCGDFYSYPTIGADGTIFVGAPDGLYAITDNGNAGQLKWNFKPAAGPWVVGTPTIGGDGTIYIGAGDKNLYALNPDGTKKWSVALGGGPSQSPAISLDGATLYVSADKLYAIDISTQQITWTYPPIGQDASINAPSWPVVGADGSIYIADGDLIAFKSDGTKSWEIALPTGTAPHAPSIGPDNTIFIGAFGGSMNAVDPLNGNKKWTYSTGTASVVYEASLGSDGTVYFVADQFYALTSTPTSAVLDFSQAGGNSMTPIIAAGGLTLVADGTQLYAYGP